MNSPLTATDLSDDRRRNDDRSQLDLPGPRASMNGLFFRSDVPGFRVDPEDEVPGFRVIPPVPPPGFNLYGTSSIQERTWPNGMLPASMARPPDLGEALASQAARLGASGRGDVARSAPPNFPDWLHKLVTMPLPKVSNAFDPRTGRRIVPYEPLINPIGSSPTTPSSVSPTGDGRTNLPRISLPPRLDPGSQGANPRPAVEKAMGSAWPQPMTDGAPYPPAPRAQIRDLRRAEKARPAMGVPPTPSVDRAADSNFMLAKVEDVDMQPRQQWKPLPQNPLTQHQVPITPPSTAPGDPPAAFGLPTQSRVEIPQRWHDEDLAPFIEAYRHAAASVAQDLTGAFTRFGNRFYEDSILRAGRDLRRLVERFADEPIKTTLSVLNSFPQTKVEGEFLASFAAVFTILANAKRGIDFEKDVLKALNALKNTNKVSVDGMGRSIPDILDPLRRGITEIKSGLEIDSSVQLRVQATYARIIGVPFNLIVSPWTRRVSKEVKRLVRETGGTIQRFDPATGVFTPFE